MVDKEGVKKVAENARIDVTDEEAEEFSEEFENILEKFEKISEVDTEDVEPPFHPIDVEATTREDEEGETLSREEVFQNTENSEQDFFKGPSVQ